MNFNVLTDEYLKQITFYYSGTLILVFSLLLWVQVYFFDRELLVASSSAIGIAFFLTTSILVFVTKLGWKCKFFSWLFNRPIIQGVWGGQFESNYDNGTIPPQEIYFVIRQKFLKISIVSYTKNIPSTSRIEALRFNSHNSDTTLDYLFETNRSMNAENKITLGLGELKLVGAGKILDGHYCTNSPSQGKITLHFISKDIKDIDTFELAQALHKNTVKASSIPGFLKR